MNLAEILFTTAARHSPRRAITDVRSGRSVSYGQLAREAERVAAFLKAEGVEPGQRIGLLAPNDLTYLPAAFGLLAAGACFVPLASNLTPTEIAEIIREVQLNGCFSSPKAAPLPSAPGHADVSARRAVVKGGECDGYAFQWIDHGAEAPPEFATLNAAFIRFTSGTTARSKGVVLSHEATAARVEASDRVLKFSEEDRILWVLPLAYHFAVTITAYVRAGSHVLLCSDTLPKAIVDGARRLRASVLYAAPLHFERMANLGPSEPLSSIRVTLSTAAPISTAVMERFESVYGVPVGQAYGIIEAGLPCINLGTEGLPPASVGRPVPGYAVAVYSDEGARLPTETIGEIAVRGDGLFSAYYSPWRLREQVENDGWFLTGDLGFLDGSGALHLKGRKKALILVAGLKFFPEEVEECINRFPGIKESRVFSRPHAHMGEVPCAEIVMEPAGCDVDALKTHCARELSSYKVPLEFTVVDTVPRTPSGKIRR